MKTISFIGAGNMGGAVARAVCKAIDPAEVVLFDIDSAKAARLADEIGCTVASSTEEAVRLSKYIMFAVKPQFYDGTAAQVMPTLKACVDAGEEKIVTSLMAGITLGGLEKTITETGMTLPVIRILPNTPAMIGEGLSLVVGNALAKECGATAELIELLKYTGLVEETTEHELDLASHIYSCSPAWVDMFIEALADGAVATRLFRDKALRYAAQGVKGSAALVLESHQHPGALKDAVCSPGGITIQGVIALEKRGFRAAVIEAVEAAEKKRQEMAR